MNKLRYRIVFNKTRGMCMAVQETARSRTKGAGQGVVDSSVPAAMRLPPLRRMPFLMVIGISGMILAGHAFAQIVADPKAPGPQQATVLNAANGVLQVNIQTPSAAGVSRNVYSQFDVPKSGAILNNSRTDVQTQLGGWVQGNPWLGKGTARVILNEVNASDPSRLRGYIEVAGDRAETVIANPAGIVVDGGGFINVSRATLTTGSPIIEDGFLKAYSVQRGQIVIDGAGFDTSKTDYTALITRSLQVNAGLWAQRLNVITGANQVDAATQATVAQAGHATGASPLFAIDVAHLGGMYANQIYLVGTEAGVGVRNAGEIGAVAGDLVVTAAGRLENSGMLQASQRLQATADVVDNKGAIQARENLAVTANNLLNAGRINAGAEALIKVQGDIINEGGTIEAARVDIAGTTLQNARGNITQTGASALALETTQVINNSGTLGRKNDPDASDASQPGGSGAPPADAGGATGGNGGGSAQPGADVPVSSGPAPVLADGRLTFRSIDNTAGTLTANGATSLRTEGLDNRGGQAYLDSLSVTGSAFDNTSGTLTVLRGFTARADSFVNDQGKLLVGVAFDGALGSFSNRAGLLQASELSVEVKRYLDNSGGTLRHLGGTTARISVGDELALNQGVLETAAGLNLRAGSISGTGSTLNVTGDLVLESGTTSAARGTWLGGGNVKLNTGALDTGGAKIVTGGGLSIDSAAIGNAGGTFAARTDVAITAADGVDNSHGIIQAGRDLRVAAAGALDNHAGSIETLSSGSVMSVSGTTVDNREGRVTNAGTGKTTLEAMSVTNSGEIGGNGNVEIEARTLTNDATGSIVSHDDMKMSVGEALLNGGRINSGGEFRMVEDNAHLSNHGVLVASGGIQITASTIDNTSGQIATTAGGAGNLSLRATGIVNKGGLIDVGGQALIESLGNFSNERGHVRADGNLTVQASERIENRGGAIETAGRMQVQGGEIGNEGGVIVAAGTQMSSIEVDRGIDTNGMIGANGLLVVKAETFRNGAQGTMSATGDLELAVRSRLANEGGTISTAGALGLDQLHATLVNSGTITSAGDVRLNIDQFDNDGGTIGSLAGASLGVKANALSNRGGRIMAGADASVLVKGNIENDAGALQAAGSLDTGAGGALSNKGGMIEASAYHGTLAVHAAAIDNTDGRIVNVGDGVASVSTSGRIDSSGLIAGNGQLEVVAATANNTGVVSSANKIEIGVGSTMNNSGMISAGSSLHMDRGDASLRNSGTIVAAGAVEMTVKTVDNTGGVIATANGSNSDLVLSAQDIANRGGTIMSDHDVALHIANGFDSRSGLVQAKGQLQLSAGGVLDASGGSIETLSADSTLQLHAGAVLNEAGRIVNAGSGATQLQVDTGLVNNGQVGGNGSLSLEAQSVVNHVHGRISGGSVALQARTSLENAGDISSHSTLKVESAEALRNHGNIVANGDIAIRSAAIDNDNGTFATVGGANGGVVLKAQSLSNRSGQIIADRALTLDVKGHLDNDRGRVQARTAVQVTIGGNLSNDGGAIEVTDIGATLALQANSIHNGGGRIVNVGQGSTAVHLVDSLENSGLIAGNGRFDLRAASISNLTAGMLASGRAMSASIGTRMENAGTINSGATLDIVAPAAEVRNGGLVMANGALNITSKHLDDDGGQLATVKGSDADVQLSAASISNRGGAILSDRDVRIASADAFDNSRGLVQAAGSLQVSAAGAVGNDGGVIETLDPSANTDLHAGALENGTGRIVNVGTGATTFAVQGKLSSAGLIAGNGRVDLAATELDNHSGANIVSGAALGITVSRNLGNAGTISSKATLGIDAAEAAVRNSGRVVSGASAILDTGTFDNSGGQLATVADSGGDIMLRAGGIANVNGSIVADGVVQTWSTGGFDNRRGTVRAKDGIGMDVVGALDNQEGVIEAAGAGATLNLQAQSIDNSAGRLVNVGLGTSRIAAAAGIVNSGLLAGNGSVDLSGVTVDNLAAGTIAAGGDLDLHVSRMLDNAGAVSAAHTLHIDEPAAQITNTGQVVAADGIVLHGASINNDGGQLATQSGGMVLSSESTLSNRSGVIAAGGDVTLNVQGSYDNSQGQVQTRGRLQIGAGGSVTNAGGALEAVGASSALALRAASIDNTAGRIVNAGSGATIIDSAADIVNSGTLGGNGALTLTALTLQNTSAGVVGSGNTMELAVRERLDNAGAVGSSANLHFDQAAASFSNSGRIGAACAIEITAATLSNRGGQLYTARNSAAAISLRSGSLDNTGGAISADGQLRAEIDSGVSNGEGMLLGGAGTTLVVGAQLGNGSGTIEAGGGSLAIQAHAVESSGRIVNGGTGVTSIDSTTDIVNSGTIAASGTLAISAQTLQNTASGAVGSGNTLDLAVREQLDNAGSIGSAGALRLDQALVHFNNSGRVAAGGAIEVTTSDLSNRGGQLYTVSGSGGAIRLHTGSLDNTSGVVSADGALAAEIGSSVINGGGTLHGGSGTTLAIGDVLANGSGTIESASGALAIQAQSADSSGRIVNAGSGTTTIFSNSTIVNDGLIGGNGALDLRALSLSNRETGQILSGGPIALGVTQRLDNAGTMNSAGSIHFDQRAADLTNSGRIGAGGTIDIAAATIINRGGQLFTANGTGAAITLQTGSLDNIGGMVSADGLLQVDVAGSVANGGGALHGGLGTRLYADGAVDNGSGTIEAGAGALQVRAQALNSSGRIVNAGVGLTAIDSVTSIVNSGTIAGNGAFDLHTPVLQNLAGGQIASGGALQLDVREDLANAGHISSGGTLVFDQAGASFSNQGQLTAAGNIALTAASFDNNGGQVATLHGSGADISVATSALNNRDGAILADGNATLLLSNDVDNTRGVLQAGGNLELTTPGIVTNASGVIEALGGASSLTLRGSAIDNGSGRISNAGSGETRLISQSRITNAGTIAAMGNLLLSGQTLANQEGATVGSGGNLALEIAQQVDNSGKINSGGTLTFEQADARFTNSGEVFSGGNAVVHVSVLNNDGGRLGTGSGSGADLSLTSQQMSNQGGRIATDRDLLVNIQTVNTLGELFAGRDFSMTLDGDYGQNVGVQQLRSNRNLSLSVSGNIVNSGALESPFVLSLSGQQITNQSGATIAGKGVIVKAGGTLTNDGEINGASLVDITAANVSNTGGIVGGDVTLAAGGLDNNGSVALIGATNSLSLGVAGTLNNTGGATLYSSGDIVIGGRGGGSTAAVNNISSTIEASGNLALNANSLSNIRENVQIVQVKTVDETIHMSMPDWYHHGDNHNSFETSAANYIPHEIYFVSASDILDDTVYLTPDGYTIHRAVIRTHANDSAFYVAASGLSTSYGQRTRLTLSEGTRVIYYTEGSRLANPDQGAPASNIRVYSDSGVTHWSGTIDFSNQYGNCSTECIRLVTQPGYDDPSSTILRETLRALAPVKEQLEVSRDAHHTVIEEQLAPGAGANAQILAGGNIYLHVSDTFENRFAQIKARGVLVKDGVAAPTNVGASLYRTHTFDGTWRTESGQIVSYERPSISEAIGLATGIIDGGQGVSISGRSFTNIDVTAGTVGNIRESVNVIGSGLTGGGSAGSYVTANAGASGSVAAHISSGAGLDDSADILVSADTNPGAAINGQLSGNVVGTQANLAGAISATGSGSGSRLADDAAASGKTNRLHAGGLVSDSGYANDSVANGGVGTSGRNNSLLAIGAVGYSGTATNGHVSGTITTSRNDSHLGNTAIGAGPSVSQQGGSMQATESAGVTKVSPSGLFIRNPDANGSYLYETRPQFANQQQWTSSDYLLKQLSFDPETTQKRLGDGFYEQRLVREQLAELTGHASYSGASDDQTYQQLLTNAVSFAREFGLRPGVALSAEQVSHLTSDIVWMESQNVMLPDGRVENVLVPKVYLAHVGKHAVQAGGALVTGNGVTIDTTESIVNSGGVIDGGNGRTLLLACQDIVNRGGTIKGSSVAVVADRDVKNESLAVTEKYDFGQNSGSYTALSNVAAITATGALDIHAGRDLSDLAGRITASSASLTAAQNIDFGTIRTGSTYQSQIAGYTEKDSSTTHQLSQISTGGDLKIAARGNLNLNGTQVAIGTAGRGTGQLLAGGNINIAAVTDEINTAVQNDPSSEQYDKQVHQNQTLVGSGITATGGLTAGAGVVEKGAINITASSITAGDALKLTATDSINIVSAQEQHLSDTALTRSSSSFLKSKTTQQADYVASSQAIGSTLSGKAVDVSAGKDINVLGSAIAGDGNVSLAAAGSVNIGASTSTLTEQHHSQVKESGFLSGNGFSFSIGTRTTTIDQTRDATTQSGQSRSMVGSLGGNLSIVAGDAIRVSGSDLAAGSNMSLDGRSVTIDPGLDKSQGKFVQSFVQDGLTFAIGGSAVNAVQTFQGMTSAASQSKDTRIKALAAAAVAMTVKDAVDDITKNGPSAKVSLTVGHSESESTEVTANNIHSGSVLTAGNNVAIRATGGGTASDIRIVGSDVHASGSVFLAADNQINLLAAQDTESQHSQSKSMSAAVGVAAELSSSAPKYGVTASASVSRGNVDGDETTQVNSHIVAGDRLTMSSGGDTNLKGAVAKGNQVVADIKGNLNIESLQDTATLDGKRQSVSMSGTVGTGAGFSGSVSQSKVDNDYASVQEQSGIRAGAGGFQVQVARNTDLKGGVISSSQQAVQAGRNSLDTASLSFSDIQNRTSSDANGISVDVNGGKNQNGSTFIPGLASGIGQVGDRQSSVVRSGISGATLMVTDPRSAQTVANLNRDVSTDKDTFQALAKGWAGAQALDEVSSQMEATKGALPRLANEIGNYAATKVAELSQIDPEEAAKWAEGGIYRITAHAALGGMGGGIDGAFGAGASAAAAPYIAKTIDAVGLPELAREAAITTVGAGIGLAAGGSVGAVAGANQIANNYLKQHAVGFKRSEQAQFDYVVAACNNGDQSACERRDNFIALSQQRDQLITNACASGSSAQCSALISGALSAGNKTILSSDGRAVVYPMGTPELKSAPSVQDGTFHGDLAKSTFDGLVMAAGDAAVAKVVSVIGKGVMAAADGVNILRRGTSLEAGLAVESRLIVDAFNE